MRYVSLFSGVEAASVAWSKLGWQPLAFAEADEFPSAVLAYRFPSVPNLGDVRNIDWKEFHERNGAVDVLVGGSPCQSFSIAGGRAGLEGESRLMYEYIRAVRDLVRASNGTSPRYIVWENVPGCLSSNKGEDFGGLLDELEDCGYFVAWRTLDSQFARVFDRASGRFRGPVPQRRRRVFLVGSLGGPSAAEILFERSCLRWDHPKSREAREALAEDAARGAGVGDCAGFKYHAGKSAGGIGWGVGSSPTLTTDYHTPAVISMTTANTKANGSNFNADGACYTLDLANSNAVAFAQNTRDEVRLFGEDGQTVGALAAQPGMKQTCYVMTQYGDVAGALNTRADSSPCADRGQNVVCMADDTSKAAIDDDLCGSLKVGGGCQ